MDKNLKRVLTMHRMQSTGLDLFYRQGYYNTSIDDILRSLALSKGAFYHHYSSKEEFFIRIVQDLIVPEIYNLLVEPLVGSEDPVKAVANCFEKALLAAERDPKDHGFVLSNFMTEFNKRNPLIMYQLREIYHVWEINLINAFQRGKQLGYVEKQTDSEAVATYLISSYIGIRTLMVEGNSVILRQQYMQRLRQHLSSLAKSYKAA